MMEAIIKGLGFGLLLSISVSPVLFSIIKQSLNHGHKGGLSFVAGVSASDITLVLISNFFTELFAEMALYKEEIAIGGCIFLASLGVYFLLFKKVNVNEQGQQVFIRFRRRDHVKLFLSGYFMNTLNPGIFFFWVTATSTIIDHTVNQRVAALTTCLLVILAADIAKVMLAGKIRNRLTPHNIHIINRVNGIILLGFAIALLVIGHRL
jgi:threonine/homoserine/homoserine lactone efflux protein